MALKQQLHQKQVQKLILAPALQQAIKLLPLTNLELIEIIDTELSQNPMLENADEVIDQKSEEEKTAELESVEKSREEAAEEFKPDEAIDSQKEGDMLEFEAYFQENFDNGFRSYFYEKKESIPLENILSNSASLWDHLDWQANLTFFDEKDKDVALYIIGNTNEDGYLVASLEEIAQAMEISSTKIEEIRGKIMRFDPVGTASLTLKECLMTQLEYLEIKDATICAIVDNYLDLVGKSDFSLLAKKLGISLSEVKSHLDIIKGLDPTPGRKYSQEKTSYVVPDIFVRKEDDELRISLNDEGQPRLRISGYYRKLLAQASKDDSESYQYLREKLKNAFWFLRSLDQRNRTVYKVAKYIVEKQKDFIEKGIEYIKPLTLIELAQEIGVHESTVGRVVTNKHIMTPGGVFPLKYFFHKSLSGDYGEEISSLRVKEKIRKLVENEDRQSPLSDIEIEQILARENLRIARRTVAKYRKQLQIAPSHIRKRKYWMEDVQ